MAENGIFGPSGFVTFHGDAAFKQRVLYKIKWHQAAHKIVQRGGYWADGKGCAVGCTIESLRLVNHSASPYPHDEHSLYESLLGVPRSMAFLEDVIFEGLSLETSKEWPARFIQAIPVGVDLGSVAGNLLLWILDDDEWGVKKFATRETRPSIEATISLLRRAKRGETMSEQEWNAASLAGDAASAAASLASAAASLAGDAASAAASLASAAASLAGDAASLAANAAAAHSSSRASSRAYYEALADKLVELLRGTNPEGAAK